MRALFCFKNKKKFAPFWSLKIGVLHPPPPKKNLIKRDSIEVIVPEGALKKKRA
jgi:hypothetical protein